MPPLFKPAAPPILPKVKMGPFFFFAALMFLLVWSQILPFFFFPPKFSSGLDYAKI